MPASQFRPQGRALAAGLVLAVCGGPRVAHAAFFAPEPEPEAAEGEQPEGEDEDPQIKRAMEAFERGEHHYAAGEFEAALEAFLDAQSLYPSADFHYDIGQCYENLGKYEEAIRAYRSYLRNKPEATDYASVKSRIVRLEKLHDEEKKKAKDAAKPAPDGDEKKSSGGKPLVITGGVLMGVGVAGAVVGTAVFGAGARKRSSQVDDLNAGNNPDGLSLGDAEAIDAAGRRAETFQFVSAGVGGAIAVVGVALLAVGLKKEKKQADASQARRPVLGPMLGSKSTGVVLSGRF